MPFYAFFCPSPHHEYSSNPRFCVATPRPRGKGRCWNVGQQAGYWVCFRSELAPCGFSWFNKYLLSMDDWRARSESGYPVWLLIGPRSTLRPRLKEELREEQKGISLTLSFSKFTSIPLHHKWESVVLLFPSRLPPVFPTAQYG